MYKKIKAWAKNLKRQIFVLYFAYKDKRVPLTAKIFTACIVAYAFSPIEAEELDRRLANINTLGCNLDNGFYENL
ncbi:uncharacterized conserved protein [Solibacillus silvestris StLB046]|uniref:Uncharacterized conserved protein n=1 Tax=Solibacillus silvestris (strain StLB046) TaxID=1002809 RepID=F2F0R9_SOLSS|nr:uncharacterized conserved protein [Solibacillus silvestris StLB046]